MDRGTLPVGGAGGPAATASTGAASPPASSTTAAGGLDITDWKVSGPTWSPDGAFDWRVAFRTTGHSGWIVQELVNTINVTSSTGAVVNTSAVDPHYWEAWAVDGSGHISPSVGAVHDMWIRPNWGANTKGSWSMSGRLHFTTTDPATQGFTPGGAKNSGILLSTTAAPAGLGPVLRWRVANGTWNDTSTPAVPHTGHWG